MAERDGQRRRKPRANANGRASDRRSYVGKWSAASGRRPATAAATTAAASAAAPATAATTKSRTGAGTRAYRYQASAKLGGAQSPAAGQRDRGATRIGRSGVEGDTRVAAATTAAAAARVLRTITDCVWMPWRS